MGEDDDRRARAARGEIGLQPGELIGSEIAHAPRLEIDDVDEADEVSAARIEGIPAVALGALAVAIEIELAIVVENVVLAGHIMHVEPGLADDLVGRIELGGLRKVADIAGVDHEGRLGRQSIHLGDRLGQRAIGVRVRGLVEADMAVAELEEAERLRFCLP